MNTLQLAYLVGRQTTPPLTRISHKPIYPARWRQPSAPSRMDWLVEPAIDLRNFLDPALPLTMFQVEHFAGRPVKMIGNVGYLLIDLIEGVA